jgi:spore coat polysaccharide biosynthesis protein SpsF
VEKNSKKKAGLIIQARMGSSRLPGKILLPVRSNPIFQYQIDRLHDVGCPIIIATSTEPADKAIVDFAIGNSLYYFRGSESNVLERYYLCARQYKLDVVIRLTSDCPLIDSVLVKDSLNSYLEENDDHLYLSNSLSRTYPRGYDFEIFSFALLEEAYKNAEDNWDKEHVTPYIAANKSGKVRVRQVINGENNSCFRLTLDTQEDFELLSLLIEKFGAEKLSGNAIIDILRTHPELVAINKHVEQKTYPQ